MVLFCLFVIITLTLIWYIYIIYTIYTIYMFYIESVLKQNNPYTELKTPPKSVYSVQSVYPPLMR